VTISSALRRHWPSTHPVGQCPRCQTPLRDGMVADADGEVSCLACSILRSLGLEGLRPVAPLPSGNYIGSTRSNCIPQLAGYRH